jgi:hypothetical protein
MLDREKIRQHHVELSYLCGRYMVEHLIRVHAAFDGDILAAVVLGTIAQHNARRFYDEVVAKSDEPMDELIARGEHLAHRRPCNAMSVSMATGIPRETVRRKIRWLVQRGWVEQVGRDKLFITRAVAKDFADFDIETLDRMHAMTVAIFATMHKRLGALPVAAAPPAPRPAQRSPRP